MNFAALARPKDWRLSVKLIAFAMIIGCGSVAALGTLAVKKSSDAILDRQTAALQAVAAERSGQIESYFSFIEGQIKTFANDRMVAQATAEFSEAFARLPEQMIPKAKNGADNTETFSKAAEQSLANYFNSEYRPRLEKADLAFRGPGVYTPDALPNKLAMAMYVAENTNPPGSKLNLDRAPQDNDYNRLHGIYHPVIRNYLQTFGYYDVFLFDLEGNIVYTVYKETDYATNFLTGPYKDSNFAEVYRAARNAPEGTVAVVDFKAYEPSYGAAAAFTSAPVFHDGQRVGVAAFQMPVDNINNVMAGRIGQTGFTRLIGNDARLRSVTPVVEGDTLLVTELTSQPARDAAAGKSGSTTYTHDNGESFLTAYGPVDIAGLDYAVVAEINMDEVLAPARSLRANLLISAAIVAAVAAAMGLFFARSLARPVHALVEALRTIAQGDFTHRAPVNRADEIGQLGVATNSMAETVGQMIRDVAAAAHEVAGAATEIAASSEEMAAGLNHQETQTAEVSSAVQELSGSVREVADRSTEASGAAQSAGSLATEGGTVVERTVSEIKAISEQVRVSVQAVTGLGAKSEQIGEIISVINDIADQTNLLALNAAIEAARAGEQGRGFAVVADEVRKLAERTQQATEQVARSIKEIQSETKTAIGQIEEGAERVDSGVQLATQAGDALRSIVDASSNLQMMVASIASAAEQQTMAADQIARNTEAISAVTRQSAEGAQQAAEATVSLSQSAEKLQQLAARFRV